MTTNVIKIDKNVPLPKATTYHGGNRRSQFHFLKELEVGDSFEVNGNTPDIRPKTAMTACYTLAKKYRGLGVYKFKDFRISVRTLHGTSAKPKTIRIWRVR